jgi:hypothetical protein
MTLPREAGSARRSVGGYDHVPVTIGRLVAFAVFEANTDAWSNTKRCFAFGRDRSARLVTQFLSFCDTSGNRCDQLRQNRDMVGLVATAETGETACDNSAAAFGDPIAFFTALQISSREKGFSRKSDI